MTNDMPARMLRLLSLLQTRREWFGAELAERLGVTGRTVRRDIDRLRELGYRVEATTGIAGGYRLASGQQLPPLLLHDDEAIAVAAALLTLAGSGVTGSPDVVLRVLAKLEQILPAPLSRRVSALTDATDAGRQHPVPRVDPKTLATIALACRDHDLLSFGHHSRTAVTSTRRVEPYTIVTAHGRWYLLAYDLDRSDWRIFRVDRIVAATPLRQRFLPRELPGPDPVTYVANSIRTAPYRHTARATVRAPAEVIAARLTTSIPGRVQPLDDHRCTVTLGADSPETIAADLVALDAPFTLDAPPELLEALHTIADRLATATRPSPDPQRP
ncbi:helix-turn-helix transcriptional regulator [Desertihabitans aurantiacus]|uniref:helix-turn-helix transcriptional regulator n=1 Tax=Desertihabitans aurantiacus TaxID=2282477 RepID=UPI000DF75E6C|nr:YafY family protein [Desertihabitans aurantiacus]